MEETMDSDIRYAGFWSRTLATVIDSIWLYGIIYAILWVLVGPDIFSSDANYTMTQFTFEWVIPLIVVMAFWIMKSATPGKMVFQMRIVDAENFQPVSTSRLLVRYLAYFVSIFPLGFGFLWIAWDKKKQGWHDKIARTVIVLGKQA
jgi:uncharacterized RDD family membrane protein YckC